MTDNEGYIVFDCGGNGPIDYGGSEKWFANYDEAEREAMSNVASGLSGGLCDEVMIYRGSKELMKKFHAVPPDDKELLFEWSKWDGVKVDNRPNRNASFCSIAGRGGLTPTRKEVSK